jgi:hypothetical protein
VERGNAQGYAGIGLGANEVIVWWKGSPPEAVAQTITKARKIVPVRVVPAAHTRAELEAAAGQIERYLRSNTNSPYHSVDIAYDGSGLQVNTETPQQKSARLPADMRLPDGIRASIAVKARPKLTGRLNDFAPYWGGGRIQNNDNGSFCTAGFAVTANGSNYMLTAGHCGRPGGGWNNGNDTLFFGTGAREHVPHDLLLISSRVSGRIWDGGVGSGEFTKGVAGWDWTWPGEYLCTSGSVSGVICDQVVSNSFTFAFCGWDAYGRYECYNDLVVANQKDGRVAGRPGDSGGPVFSLAGSGRVTAKGTITGGIGTSGLIFQDFGTAWRDFGVTPIVG